MDEQVNCIVCEKKLALAPIFVTLVFVCRRQTVNAGCQAEENLRLEWSEAA